MSRNHLFPDLGQGMLAVRERNSSKYPVHLPWECVCLRIPKEQNIGYYFLQCILKDFINLCARFMY